MKLLAQIAAASVLASNVFAQQPSTAAKPAQSGYTGEGFVIEQSKTLFYFDGDGTGRREVYLKILAESESGVQQWGQVVAGYNAGNETLELPLIRVTKADGSIVDTPPTAIQDLTSQVQRIAPVYTDFREKHVAVESFRPGDTLEVRIVSRVRTAYAPGQFWGDYNFNENAIVLDEQLDLDVPANRQLIVRSRPGLEPTIVEASGRRRYHWTSSHKAREAPDKKKDDLADAEPKPPAVRFTSFTGWQQVGEWFGSLEAASRVVTPEIRAKAQELTQGKTSDLERLAAIYDYVAENFRYVSLSLGAGRYQPRAAASVLSTEYGDCKDKHTLLATLIDAAGLHASAVLINPYVKLDPDFPSPSQFNHVITRAVVDGQVVWMDTTTEVAPFRMLLSALLDKQALLIDGAKSHLEKTAAKNAEPSRATADITGTVDAAGALSARVKLSFRGDGEILMRSAFRGVPAAQWKELLDPLAQGWHIPGEVSDWHVSDPVATKEPFTIDFAVHDPSFVTWGPSTIAIDLPLRDFAADADSVDEESKAAVKFGELKTFTSTVRLEFPDGAVPAAPLPVSLQRDYGTYASVYTVDGHAIVVKRTTTNLVTELPASRRSDYAAFVRVVNNDGKQRISLTSSVPAAPAAGSSEADVQRLGSAGFQAVQAREYRKAVDLLTRVVQLDPKSRTAWNNLGNAYLGLNQTDDAITAYKKQIEINPFDEYAYNNLGRAFRSRKQYADAEAAFLKQIEVNPLDKYTHSNLGSMYLEQQKYDAAAVELEKAVSITPNSSSLEVQLGRAYLNAGKNDAASKAFDKAVSLSPSPGVWNSVAYELALHAMDLDRAQRYAESAIAVEDAASRNFDLDHVDARALASAGALAAYWDTLGWVYFERGDARRAETFVSAAWAIDQHAEVGDHLGQIYEKQGRREDAERAYARALSASNPSPDVRKHLAALVGDARVEEFVSKYRSDLVASRTLPLKSAKGPAGKHADYFILIAQPGRIEGATFVEGDAELRTVAPALQMLPVVNVFPDDQPAKLVRRGIVACGSDGACSFTLLLPEDARPAKQ